MIQNIQLTIVVLEYNSNELIGPCMMQDPEINFW